MASTFMQIAVAANPSYSDVQNIRGLLELVDIDYQSIAAVTITVQELMPDGTWRDRWATGATNTDAQYIPVRVATETGGVASTSAAHIPLRSEFGWRVRVAGATSGAVAVFVSLDQG